MSRPDRSAPGGVPERRVLVAGPYETVHDQPLLLVVRGTDAGLLSCVRSTWQRVREPETHPCPLTVLTEGATGTDRRWSRALAGLPVSATTIHRDTFRQRYATAPLRDVELPAVLLEDRGALTLLVGRDRIAAAADVCELVDTVSGALQRTDIL